MVSTTLPLSHRFAQRLPGFSVPCEPMQVASPTLLQFNAQLAEELGLGIDPNDEVQLSRIFTGQELLPGSCPVAQAYAGHQFGGFVPQLGDGRALLLGEAVDRDGQYRDIALKGSGPTPFSRGGDGKAAIGPVLREYVVSEAMYALGIPTTRALAAVGTGETVMRTRSLPGAMLTRVAASHLRVGSFEYAAARRRTDQVRELADFAIERHYADVVGEENRYLELLQAIADRQAKLIAQWMSVGFVHGVMNTDNMTISGETIDYGPCAFMEAYDPAAVFSSIDSMGRYAFSNQPQIARWNLARLAETLLSLIDPEEPQRAAEAATEIITEFESRHNTLYQTNMREKLGLDADSEYDSEDQRLLHDWLGLLQSNQVDYTLAFRSLADAADENTATTLSLFPSGEVEPWLEQWRNRLEKQPISDVASRLRASNPLYIPRNHLVEEALDAASEHGDLKPFKRLLQVLDSPFQEQPESESFATPAPRDFTACYKTFCGT
ncbi:MAG TPA: YdiU family protein [Planctomycetaceae bacterium]|nr:YdiU family protein [Planctomycetaceae bacterium]